MRGGGGGGGGGVEALTEQSLPLDNATSFMTWLERLVAVTVQERIEALTERLETSSTVGEDKPVRDRPEDAADFGSKTKRGRTSFF